MDNNAGLDSPELSVSASYPRDTWPDTLRDLFAELGCPPELQKPFEKLVCRAESIMSDGSPGTVEHSTFGEQVCDVLAFIWSTSNPGIAVACVLSILGRNPLTEQAVANRFGVTRACVSKVMTVVRDRYQMSPRVGRTESSREVYAQACFTRSAIRRKRTTWKHLQLLKAEN